MNIHKGFVFLVSNELELFLLTSIMKLIKAHVRSFGYVLYNCGNDDDVGDNVVRFNLCCTLDETHFM